MENTTSSQESNDNIQQDALFGVSSSEIIHALHNGELIETGLPAAAENAFDKDQIVNQQDQLDIVNPAEEETSISNQSITSVEGQTEHKSAETVEQEKIPGDKEISTQLSEKTQGF